MNFKDLTKKLWDYYLINNLNVEDFSEKMMDNDCVIIGTGKHEMYHNLEDFIKDLNIDLNKRNDIEFNYKDFWCEDKMLSNDICMVYGGIYIFWKSSDEKVSIDMDTRFTVIYKRIDDKWKVVHMHHSIPNFEQAEGEFYPKTMAEQVYEERTKKELYENLAKKDQLTDLWNYRTFESLFKDYPKDDSWLLAIDLDDFKSVNDNFGHIEGNNLLKRIANILKASVRADDVVCRMGGDEFLILCGNIVDDEGVESLISRIFSISEGIRDKYYSGMSIGATKVRKDDNAESAFKRADYALYIVKQNGKNSWQKVI